MGSILLVSLKQDTAGSHWPWRLDWVRLIAELLAREARASGGQ